MGGLLKRGAVAAVILGLGLAGGAAQAATKTYLITGDVSYTGLAGNSASDVFNTSVTSFSATLVFDDAAAPFVGPATHSDSIYVYDFASYYYTSLSLTLGSDSWTWLGGTNPTGDNYFVVTDAISNGTGTIEDQVQLAATEDKSFAPGQHIDVLAMFFSNSNLSTLSSTDIPTVAELNALSDQSGYLLVKSDANLNVGRADFSNFVFSDVTGVVPEPATWALMILGFAGLGFAARRRHICA